MGHWDDAYEEMYGEADKRNRELDNKAENYKERMIKELSDKDKIDIMFEYFLKNEKRDNILKLGKSYLKENN